jgi:hypothetical protein
LTDFGVPNALADPELELHGPGSFRTVTNDNWRDDPAQVGFIKDVGLAPFHEAESAIYIGLSLEPGAYTAVVRGKDNSSGVALVEAYTVGGPLSPFSNMSTRAFVSTGDDRVIGGVTLGGYPGAGRIVVRGIGPHLAVFEVENALADPTIELRDGNGALVLANNNWQDDPVQAAEITAAGLAPESPLEAGIAATLGPGLYTALLAGLNNGTGVGLIEVYDRGGP